jgi:hypothetical protein
LDDFMANPNLEDFPFERDPEASRMKAPYSDELEACLKEGKVAYEEQTESGPTGTGPGGTRLGAAALIEHETRVAASMDRIPCYDTMILFQRSGRVFP